MEPSPRFLRKLLQCAMWAVDTIAMERTALPLESIGVTWYLATQSPPLLQHVSNWSTFNGLKGRTEQGTPSSRAQPYLIIRLRSEPLSFRVVVVISTSFYGENLLSKFTPYKNLISKSPSCSKQEPKVNTGWPVCTHLLTPPHHTTPSHSTLIVHSLLGCVAVSRIPSFFRLSTLHEDTTVFLYCRKEAVVRDTRCNLTSTPSAVVSE